MVAFGYAQQDLALSNLRVKTIRLNVSDTFLTLDSFSIIPHSIEIFENGIRINPEFEFNESKALLFVKNPKVRSLVITYRVLPFRTRYENPMQAQLRESFKYSPRLYKAEAIKRFSYIKNDKLDLDGISYNGSLYRGVTVGNNQDMALHSGFNMSLSGRLQNGLEINASITDANIPLQPEGNSASLQEFDRIFIQLKKDNHQGIVGDFDVKNINESYFLKYDRKLQGLTYHSKFEFDTSKQLEVGATAAITRGVFARNTFIAKEKNQGPYRLFGNNGESFLIIIAGTEKVFINGQLMKRGFDQDYVINYNIGEIVFTPKRMITQDLRIIVEFQYSDRNFFRSTLEAHAIYRSTKSKMYAQIFSESDNKNQPLNLKLNESQITRLKEIGNQIDSAYISSESLTTWDAARITYQRKDTVVQNQNYSSIFKWAETPLDTVYTVIFTFVGVNKGHYNIKASSANGTVFEWVAPQNGILQGSYEAITKISTPKSHLQAIIGGDIKLNSWLQASAEVTYTQNDLNEFSEKDNDKNSGTGALLKLIGAKKLDSFKQISISIQNEYTSSNFSPVTRFRNLEFNRDWDLQIQSRNDVFQNMLTSNMAYQNKIIKLRTQWNAFFMDTMYQGLQNITDFEGEKGSIKWSLTSNVLKTKALDSTSTFFRPKGTFNYSFLKKNPMTASVGFAFEIKEKKAVNSENISTNSFDWKNYFFNLASNPKASSRFNFGYIYRTERYSDGITFLAPKIISHTLNLNGVVEKNLNHLFKFNFSYRNFVNTDTGIKSKELIHNYLGRLDYNGQFLRGFMKINTLYELKAGQEQKTQITYVKATNGYGNYAWKDLNNNGVFEIDEAYVSNFNFENRYIRFYTLLPDFVPANEILFNHFLWLQPKAIWHSKKDWRKWASKFSYQLRFDIQRKSTFSQSQTVSEFLSPFESVSSTNLIVSRFNLFNQLAFQKNESNFGADLEWSYIDAKNLMSNGLESYATQLFNLKLRYNLSSYFTLLGKISNGIKRNQSDFFADRNYSFILNEVENTLSILPHKNLKINLNANYAFKSSNLQYLVQQQGDIELLLSRKNNGMIEAKFSTLILNYGKIKENPQVELAMLNGVQAGTNFIWSLNFGQKLTDLLQLNLVYNGRKNTQSDKMIHSANMEVRAIF
jgi:hypothetical protein